MPVDLKGESHLQELVNGAVLAWVDFKTLHSLAFSENIEKVSQQLVVLVGDKLCLLRDNRGVYFHLPIQDTHVLCQNKIVSILQVCMLSELVYT